MRKRIFDMDGVFYPYTPEAFENIQASIAKAAIMLGAPLTFDEAFKISRQSYIDHNQSTQLFIDNYGMTHRDLMVTSFEESDETIIIPDKKLIDEFRKVAMPHRDSQVVLTGSIENWASRLLPRLNLQDCFKAVVCVDHCDFHVKHLSYVPFEKALALLDAEPGDTDMSEDTIDNLKMAKAMGMRTIFIHHNKPMIELPSFIDVQVAQPAEVYHLDMQP